MSRSKKRKPRCYISSKMRGLKLFGFPQFDEARDIMRAKGWIVVSPADLDRNIGFDPNEDEGYDFNIEEAMRRDIQTLLYMDAIVVFGDWRHSLGASIELLVAQTIGLPVYELNVATKRLHKLTSPTTIAHVVIGTAA